MFSDYDSPVGRLTLRAEAGRLTGLWLEGQKYFGASSKIVESREEPVLLQAAAWLDRYFAGLRPEPRELPLAPAGTVFQRAVWEMLCDIPYGRRTTYGALAKALNTSARAVGGAVARNPISIIIPCHRVVGADGSLTGYAGGTDRKRWLLQWEHME